MSTTRPSGGGGTGGTCLRPCVGAALCGLMAVLAFLFEALPLVLAPGYRYGHALHGFQSGSSDRPVAAQGGALQRLRSCPGRRGSHRKQLIKLFRLVPKQ